MGWSPVVTTCVIQFLAGALATTCLLVTCGRVSAPDRAWRLPLACGTALWSAGQLLSGLGPGSPATPLGRLAGLAVLALPVCALAALSRLPTVSRLPAGGVVSVLDTTVITGSLFVLTWVTALGAATPAQPLADLVLVICVVLLARFRAPLNPRALAGIGYGLVLIAVADTGHRHLERLGTTGGAVALLHTTALVAGALLIAHGALAGPSGQQDGQQDGGPERALRLLPYLPLSGAALVLAGQLVGGVRIGPVESVVAVALGGIVVLRQFFTGLDNVRLVRELRESQDRLREQAYQDSLTGLANRALFDQRLRRAIRGGRPLGLIFCDLDDFKAVNDRLGHNAGDDLLRAVADRLRGCVRPADTIARLGGDEFAVLIEDASQPADVIGRGILAAVGRPFLVPHHDGRTRVRVGASVGVAVLDRVAPDTSPESLLAGVDQAMYVAKRRGKNQLVTFRHGAPAEPGQDRYLPLFDPAAPRHTTEFPITGSTPPPPGLPRVMDPQTGPIPRPGSLTPAARYRASGQARPGPPRPQLSEADEKAEEKDRLVAATIRSAQRVAAEFEALEKESERREAEQAAAARRALEALGIEAEVRAGTRAEAEVIPLSRATGILREKKRRAQEAAAVPGESEPESEPDTAALEHAEQLATLSSDHIDVLYRPVLGLTSGSLVGLSTSVRWRHPVHGVIDAGPLMAAAEQAGLRTPLEERLLDSICADIALLRRAPDWDALVAHVPLSARYITDERLTTVVERTLRRRELPGEALVLHLTETGPVPDLDAAAAVLERVRALGVGIGLDAFGAAPAGLGLLTRLPVGTLTLHESLGSADPGSRAATVLSGTLAMAAGLDLTLIADGVRDQAQADRLGELGVGQAQGPLYGEPVPLPDLDLVRILRNPSR
ncbi:bifunctional diguanylate cyclase/phosphodiesterase [Kineosporia sp. J2-2]|uniref:Bifunctional diguanylate cyclase/phosphodiesterase n=1 Tax=Kineosporia corallincola TaxID=2835133 RepID=A0ABS5TN10_9ACTN|nr:bifunctional diguanylate cyclase/phosphodiesterase [Kineosporia corallincola]MBT0772476.1 bifunctional diguanylate cyclase/phosphodiesterase [Kineosporia corallincola]